jgi:hypothetical protein
MTPHQVPKPVECARRVVTDLRVRPLGRDVGSSGLPIWSKPAREHTSEGRGGWSPGALRQNHPRGGWMLTPAAACRSSCLARPSAGSTREREGLALWLRLRVMRARGQMHAAPPQTIDRPRPRSAHGTDKAALLRFYQNPMLNIADCARAAVRAHAGET